MRSTAATVFHVHNLASQVDAKAVEVRVILGVPIVCEDQLAFDVAVRAVRVVSGKLSFVARVFVLVEYGFLHLCDKTSWTCRLEASQSRSWKQRLELLDLGLESPLAKLAQRPLGDSTCTWCAGVIRFPRHDARVLIHACRVWSLSNDGFARAQRVQQTAG